MRDPKDIKIGGRTLREILDLHKEWINNDLTQADLRRADLKESKFLNTTLGGTLFCFTDLSKIQDLDTCNHLSPSCVDQHTLISHRAIFLCLS